MKTRSFLWLAALVALGCSEAPSAPNAVVTHSNANLLANFPPPPMAILASVSSEYTSFSATYFLNPPGNNGWISFSQQQPAGTTITSSARITYRNGITTGTGTVTLSKIGGGAPLTINLKTAVVSVGSVWLHTCTSSCGSLDLLIPGRENGKVSVNLFNPAYGGEVVGGGDVVIGR